MEPSTATREAEGHHPGDQLGAEAHLPGTLPRIQNPGRVSIRQHPFPEPPGGPGADSGQLHPGQIVLGLAACGQGNRIRFATAASLILDRAVK